MPTLKPYTAALEKPDRGLPVVPGEAYGSGIGEAITKGAHEIVKAKEEGEQQTALVGNAQVRAKYAKALDDAQNNGTPIGPLKEKMNDELTKIGENFVTTGGTAALDYHIARSNEIFDNQANRIEVTRASETARLQSMNFVQKQSAVIASNPLYLETALQDTDSLVATLNVPPEKRALAAAEIKNQLNAAAAMATARIDPEQAKKDLEGGKWDLTPDQRRLGISQADAQIRAKRVDAQYQHSLKQQQIHEASELAANKLTIGIIGGKIRDKDIMNDPDLTSETRRALIGFLAARTHELQRETKVSDPATKLRLFMAINAPDNDPRRIYTNAPILAEVEHGTLSTTDATAYMAMVANNKDENNRSIGVRINALSSRVSASIAQDPQFTAQPALINAIQLDYISRVEDRVREIRASGKGNPNDIFDRKSPLYVGSDEFIQSSIDDIKHQVRSRGVTKAMTIEPLMFPDGVRRVWNGQEPKSDWKKNWTPVETPKTDTGAKVDYESYVQKAPRGSYYVEQKSPRGTQLPRELTHASYATKADAVKAVKKFFEGE